MATHNVLTPNTNVEILPLTLMNCENNTGVIVKSCLTYCCNDGTSNQQFCEKYTVKYMVKSCTNCFFVETDFCRTDLVELP